MSWFYRKLIRPALFSQQPEDAHHRAINSLAWVSNHPFACDALESFFAAPPLPVDLFGLRFPNPVGLAAGMDKCADAVPAWAALGFGFSELGGVTWHPQPGNPSPRMFRAVADEAIINRMGFNNPGAEALAEKLRGWRTRGLWPRHPVGINLGKSKITPLEKAAEDYANSFRALRDLADFFVVNVSSPNTPGLRQLQDKAALDEILAAIQEVQNSPTKSVVSGQWPAASAGGHQTSSQASPAADYGLRTTDSKPILIKVAPDLTFDALDEILELTGQRNIAGIVATNTTITRPATDDTDVQHIYSETGGLSGRPLRDRSTEVIRHLYRQSHGKLPIIGVGGIFNADDAWKKISAGASLVQIYTGLVYEGPGLVQDIVAGLVGKLGRECASNLLEKVGSAT
ncbi:MAG: quinone-dependent dihydroorotate dehydrogenase [Verrucomicrobia bacterium]|nr:quinone-dependent dihydroorotate dehydrogenase [Verrucomicrobiota bacterium]